MKRDKIFANDAYDKGLISKTYQQFIQLNIKKPNNPNKKKFAENLNRHLSKEDMQMVYRHMNRYSALVILRETELKRTMRSSSHTSHTLFDDYHQKVYKLGTSQWSSS